MSRSPTYCRVLIPPPPEQEGGAARPRPSRGTREPPPAQGAERPARPMTPAKGEPRLAGRQTHPTFPPASPPPPDTASARARQLQQVGEGARATPRRAGPPPAVTFRFPRPAEQGPRHKTEHRDPPILAHPVGKRDTRVHVLPIFSTHTWARRPHSPEKKASSPPPPAPRNPGNSALGLRRAPPGPPHPRAKRGLALVYLAGASGRASVRGPVPRPGPPAAPPPGWGRAGCRRHSAGRGGCAEERAGGRGKGGPRGGGGLTCATAMLTAAESLSRAEEGSRAARRKGLWGHRGSAGDGSRLVVPRPSREQATRLVPGDLSCGHPFHPRAWVPGTGAYRGRGADPEASSPRQPQAARPSPAEGKPPPVSA